MHDFPVRFIVLFCIASGSVAAQQASSWTFSSALSTAVGLSQETTPDSAEGKVLSSIADSITALRNRYSAQGHNLDTSDAIAKHLSADYIASISDDLALLDDLPSEQKERLELLGTVANDLALKVAYRPTSLPGVATAVADTVMVQFTVGKPTDHSIASGTLSFHKTSCALARGKPRPPGQILSNGRASFTVPMPPGCVFVWVQSGDKVLESKAQDIGMGGVATATISFFEDAR